MSSTTDFAEVDALLARACDAREVPGVVGILADRDGVRFLEAYGAENIVSGAAMRTDQIFRVASLTKAVVAIAVLGLVERGELDLDTPVGDLIPAFDEVQVLDGFDGPNGDTPRLRAPLTRATVRHLMTHTSGLTYDAFDANLLRYGEVSGVPMPSTGLMSSFRSPMMFDPGERFAYGMSTDWTGLVVEAITGEPLDQVLHARVLEPLGLSDTAFVLDAERQQRLAAVHLRASGGTFEVIDFEWPANPEFHSAGHGLYCTAGDYASIQRLFLRGGELDGVRLLHPSTVALMTSDQLGQVRMERLPTARPEFTYDLDVGPGVTWGLDTMITVTPRPGMRPAGSFGWCGTFNNYYWIDPVNDLAAALHMSYLPLFDPRATALYEAFERTVYASLADSG